METVKTKAECEHAALFLALSDVTAYESQVYERPHGCTYSSYGYLNWYPPTGAKGIPVDCGSKQGGYIFGCICRKSKHMSIRSNALKYHQYLEVDSILTILISHLFHCTVSMFILEVFKYWMWETIKEGEKDHICFDRFRFVEENGSYGVPNKVQFRGNKLYSQDGHTFNIKGWGSNTQESAKHWCAWGLVNVIMEFDEPKAFLSYKFETKDRDSSK